MQRQFTKKVGRFQAGEVFDYPLQTWEGIARSAKQPLDKITCDVIPPRKALRTRKAAPKVEAHGN
jgi:hypothetical protein